MASSKTEPPPPQHHHYNPLPHDQNDNVLPSSYSSHLPQRRTTILLTVLLLLFSSLYLFWPSDPSVKIVRLKLKKVHVHTRPRVTIDVSMAVRIKVRNGDVYSMDYDALEVGVGYRGKRLGQVRFQQGHVRAFGSSYVDAEVEFNGVGVFSDVVLLLEDLAKGTVPFDTVTEVRGKLGVLVFHFPLRARVSCEILVNMMNQTIFRHNCYEVSTLDLHG
uniref:uncharacterized protein LOC101294785 isoform X1 n=2 Tax=Fragaria vesca subsp. vesca TaxID=101020 RepID=UPI0005CA7212|nr:PREDICTED: uncharacterized protein LOC101294785 isoform X1 [Fragaria vesca subsp. vesca]